MLTIGDFNSFWVFLGHPVQYVFNVIDTALYSIVSCDVVKCPLYTFANV